MKQVIKRILFLLPALILQFLWYFLLLRFLSNWSTIINLLLTFFAVIFVLYIITKEDDGTYKILWLLAILGLPILGTVLYLMFGNKRTTRSLTKKLEPVQQRTKKLFDSSDLDEWSESRMKQTFSYVEKMSGFVTKKNEYVKYYPLGENLFEDLLVDLEKATSFIFIEYFIVEHGRMWDSIVAILEEKVKQGVDVRVMYDDVGSISTYSFSETRKLEEKGIRCVIFNPVTYIKGTLNYRDHRKMTIIDGSISYSGGINLADEYINDFEKYGHWKDIGFKLTGDPVKEYTRMFIDFWDAFSKEPIPDVFYESEEGKNVNFYDGYVLSYYDSPNRIENISNELFCELLNQATQKAYFYTPYLILGDKLLDAFKTAARRGVDIRIIVPGIPDKKLVYRMTQSFYFPLLESGVKIYQYDPGFVHAKASIFDGRVGTIGTVNLDYRSLFLHFENNSLFYKSSVLNDLEKDFLETQNKCTQMVLGENVKFSFIRWFINGILRVISPLC